MQKGSARKVRTDKKRDVKPTIPVELKDTIYRISYVVDTPVKDIVETICQFGLDSRKVITVLSENFKRNVKFHNTLFIGDLDKPSVQRLKSGTRTERISTRLQQPDYENLVTLAFALDVTPSRAAALLIDASIRHSDFVNSYFQQHLSETLNYNRMIELRKIINFINNNNPYDETVSWLALISYIYAEIKDSAVSFNETLNDFIDKWK
ncbi:hypothetical protein [Lysinibacillus fusiformis]|uniref:hypothetical protein n=1 Tax=Lysinibacillus fusiformis TaxID=28031 RepID=UPI000D336531|nr:hypothetical protein [Lysinibacillus fusiformis]MED4672433.1 hypothetical protein [Lysinibacillus fusiformis]RDV25824.1 hypothetical protein C7B90_21770 [Lysinibacillus fusiformis]GED66239.1 hypothetical protein LFU01_46910 [Lysinibacillus fusiformis]